MENFDIDEGHILHLLHNNFWSEELLGEYFSHTADYILTKKQKLILELKVQGTSDKEICKLMRFKSSTLRRQITTIKSKFRNKMNLRVSDLKPEWMKSEYVKKNQKKKASSN